MILLLYFIFKAYDISLTFAIAVISQDKIRYFGLSIRGLDN